MEQERTEKLTRKQDQKKQPKRIYLTVGIIVLGLILIGGIFFYYSNASNNYIKKIELAQKYLEDNDYEKALLSFQEAVEIDPKKAEGYEGILEVAEKTGQADLLKDNYKKLYEITGDENYNLSDYDLAIKAYQTYLPGFYEELSEESPLIDYQRPYDGLWIFDVNEDGTPEIFVEANLGNEVSDYYYFTYKDGKVKKIGEAKLTAQIFKGEDSSESGKLLVYTFTSVSNRIYEVSYLDFDGEKISFVPLKSNLKYTGSSDFSGYEIPIRTPTEDDFFSEN